MNNTSRFKIYAILAALLLAAGGVVWLSHGKEHSGKVRPEKTVLTTKQVTQLPQQADTIDAQQAELRDAILEYAEHATRGFGWSRFVFQYIGRDLDLTTDQETQLKDALDALKIHVMEMLAGAASYKKTDACTIIIQTGLSQDQTAEVENRLYTELRDIVGAEKLKLLNDTFDRGIRDYISLLGSSDRQYTIIGMSRDDMLKGKKTEQPLITAEAFVIKVRYNLSDGVFQTYHESVWQSSSKNPFIEKMEEIGGMGIATIKMINEADN